MQSNYVDCECGTFDHTLRIITDKENQEVYIEVHLNKHYPWYMRIWLALNYILGYDIQGCYDCTMLGKEKIKELIKTLQEVANET